MTTLLLFAAALAAAAAMRSIHRHEERREIDAAAVARLQESGSFPEVAGSCLDNAPRTCKSCQSRPRLDCPLCRGYGSPATARMMEQLEDDLERARR